MNKQGAFLVGPRPYCVHQDTLNRLPPSLETMVQLPKEGIGLGSEFQTLGVLQQISSTRICASSLSGCSGAPAQETHVLSLL